mgnify:CR=1 FL=1
MNQQNFGNQGPFGNFQNMMTQFQQFNQNFRGNAYQQVQQLLNSGQMSQEQFNQLSNVARWFQQMMGGGR